MKRILASLACVFSRRLFSRRTRLLPPSRPRSLKEVPITSKSPEAIEHFRKGRDLSDNLRQSEAAQGVRSGGEARSRFRAGPGLSRSIDARRRRFERHRRCEGEVGVSVQARAAHDRCDPRSAVKARSRRAQTRGPSWPKPCRDDWRVHMGRGSQLYVSQKYSEAIESLNKAVSLNPNAGPAYNMIGYAHLVQGQTGPAIEALTKYAAANPD